MARTRSEAIADAVARRIMQNTKKHWRTLHADALQELSDMSTTTDKMNTQNSELRPVVVKQTDHKALEGSNAPNDFRSQAAQPVMPPQPAPRGETNDLNEGVGA